jgi:hypothetical protein
MDIRVPVEVAAFVISTGANQSDEVAGELDEAIVTYILDTNAEFTNTSDTHTIAGTGSG